MASYKDFNSDDPRDCGSGLELWPNIENVLKSWKIVLSHLIYIYEKHMLDYDVIEVVYLNCEIRVSWARVLGPGTGTLLPNIEHVLNRLLWCQIHMYD
jgi:hypothetical protein